MKNKMDFEITLTPALSHPMGEGESFAVSNEILRLDLPDGRSQNRKQSLAIPSPVGGERGRVRVGLPHFKFSLAIIFSAALLAGCSKSAGDKLAADAPEKAPEKAEAQDKAG